VNLDPHTPVIIGAAQVSQWADEHEHPTEAADAIDLMAAAVRSAAADTGVDVAIRDLQFVAVTAGLWRHRDPGRMIAEQIGASNVHSLLTDFGGQMPINLAGHLADEIAAGRLDMAVLVGGEAAVTRRRLRSIGLKPRERLEPSHAYSHRWGPELDMGDDTAIACGASLPINSYAILDSAIRAHRGESTSVGRQRAALMWERYGAVAAANPHASDRSAPDTTKILEATADNRMVSWPYTKAMCANNIVDRAGALIFTSTEVADRLGVPAESRIHPHLTLESADTPNLLNRDRLHRVPGLEALAAVLRNRLGGIDTVSHFDIYACFPSIVELTFDALGIPADSVPTVTGGLAFAGAPMNFAAGQSLAAMVNELRNDPGSLGLVHGNGGHAAKHSLMVLSTTPPLDRHETINCGFVPATRQIASPDTAAEIVIDGFTVQHTKDGPMRAIAACRTDDGLMAWAHSTDPELMSSLMDSEPVGWSGRIDRGRLLL